MKQQNKSAAYKSDFKISSLIIRLIIVLTTFITLLFFAEVYNQIVFTFIAWMFIFAVIVENAGKIMGR